MKNGIRGFKILHGGEAIDERTINEASVNGERMTSFHSDMT